MKSILNTIENNLAEFAATVGPWIAPLPSAFFVWRAGVVHLDMPQWIAIVAAGVIELLGLASTSITLTLYEYNQSKRKSDQPAPFVLAALIIGAYFFTVILLAVVLDVFPQFSRYAIAIFPFLSIAGVGVLALRMDHNRRLEIIEENKEEERQKRQERKRAAKAEKAAMRTETKPAIIPERSATNRPVFAADTGEATRIEAARILHIAPDISGSELGRRLGKSERLGRMLKAEIQNGNGRTKAKV